MHKNVAGACRKIELIPWWLIISFQGTPGTEVIRAIPEQPLQSIAEGWRR